MLNNHVYNLLLQATQEHKSLWRIKDDYKKDAHDCAECTAFWQKMEKDKEGHVAELEEIMQKAYQVGGFLINSHEETPLAEPRGVLCQ